VRPESLDDDKMPPEPGKGSVFQARRNAPTQRARLPSSPSLARVSQTSFQLFDDILRRTLGERASAFRSNKTALLGVIGFCGGAIGVLPAELFPRINLASYYAAQIIYVAAWTAIASGVLTLALCFAGEYYLRKTEIAGQVIFKSLLSGVLAGALAGAIAQAIYGTRADAEFASEFLLRPACWAFMGALLGWRISTTLPNMGAGRAMAGGAAGGALGAIIFLLTGIVFPQFLGRMIGFGALGSALGLSLAAADALFRQAVLEVRWAYNETTSIPLGPRPVYIGGGDDHVSISGLPEHAVSITLENGRIRYTESASGRKTDLKDGSRIQIGRVELVIQAKKLANSSSGTLPEKE
jgi:hypothetical protein